MHSFNEYMLILLFCYKDSQFSFFFLRFLLPLNLCLWIICLKPDGPRGPSGVPRQRSVHGDPELRRVFSQLYGPGGSSNNNNMCWDHTLCALGNLSQLKRHKKTILVSIAPWLGLCAGCPHLVNLCPNGLSSKENGSVTPLHLDCVQTR